MKEMVSNLQDEVSTLREQVAELTHLVKQGFARMAEMPTVATSNGLGYKLCIHDWVSSIPT